VEVLPHCAIVPNLYQHAPQSEEAEVYPTHSKEQEDEINQELIATAVVELFADRKKDVTRFVYSHDYDTSCPIIWFDK